MTFFFNATTAKNLCCFLPTYGWLFCYVDGIFGTGVFNFKILFSSFFPIAHALGVISMPSLPKQCGGGEDDITLFSVGGFVDFSTYSLIHIKLKTHLLIGCPFFFQDLFTDIFPFSGVGILFGH